MFFPLSPRIIPDTVLSLFVSNVRILNYYISQSNPLLAPHYISISLPIALPIVILYRLPAGGVLTHLCELFVTRNATCWNREDVHNWCRATASRLISQYDSDADLMHRVCHSINCYTALRCIILSFRSNPPQFLFQSTLIAINSFSYTRTHSLSQTHSPLLSLSLSLTPSLSLSLQTMVGQEELYRSICHPRSPYNKYLKAVPEDFLEVSTVQYNTVQYGSTYSTDLCSVLFLYILLFV